MNEGKEREHEEKININRFVVGHGDVPVQSGDSAGDRYSGCGAE